MVANQRNSEGVHLLLSSGARADAGSYSGWTPLMLACMRGDAEAVELLLQYGADPNVFPDVESMECKEGCSTTNALMVAVSRGHLEVVKRLLQYGADPLANSSDGVTALDTARWCVPGGYLHAEVQAILPILEAAVEKP